MKMNVFTDTQLILMYQNHEPKAFEELLKRHKSKVFTTIYLIVKDKDTANDLTQDVFCKVVDKLKAGQYHEDGKFKHWLVRMAHNLAIDYYRKNSKKYYVRDNEDNNLFDTLMIFDRDADHDLLHTEIKNILSEAIKHLPEEQKQVLLLRHYAEMSFKDIASYTGVSLNTALGRMRYALINLRKKLTPQFAYEPNIYSP
ncbi:MAG: sigma-70 family RNA polymerase sigma factor [Cytophagales bacterium]|nr:sigma-70 family RNA polymerase sigma factor [Cytophagales bacterium]